jgi:hypothetical protein
VRGNAKRLRRGREIVNGSSSSEPESAWVTAVLLADVVMRDEFAPVSRRQALIDFLQEPVFVFDERLYCFLHSV